MVNYENNLEGHSILCSYGNQVKTSISRCGHRCTDLDIPIAGEVEENEKLKNLLNWGKFSLRNGRSQNFHITGSIRNT